MDEKDMILFDGNEFAQYEGMLVGNQAGLEKLKILIDQAIDKGNSEKGIGEYYAGVICIQDKDSPFGKIHNSILSNIVMSILGITIMTSLTIGIISIIKWISSIF